MEIDGLQTETLRKFRKQTFEDTPWDTVFKDSIVTCKRCLNSIRAFVLRQNWGQYEKSLKELSMRLTWLDEISHWTTKIATEAKELANDPTWCCADTPSETYFVDAIRRGVKDLVTNYTIKSNTKIGRVPKKW